MTSPNSPRSARSAASGRSARLALKELRETLRDRRTLITLILMPLLVYPLLGVILQKALLSSLDKPEEPSYRVAFCSSADAHRFKELYMKGLAELPTDTSSPEFEWYGPERPNADCNAEENIAGGAVELVVRFHGQEDGSDSQIELIYQKDNRDSQAAALLIQERLGLVLNPEHSMPAESPQSKTKPAKLVLKAIEATAGKAAKFSLATFVPLMLILMTVTGAVYPAIDLTAGERERGTLEVLVAAPVPRMQLLGAKFVAVLTVAMLTAIVNLLAMIVTLYASGLESLVFGEGGVSWSVMGQIFALLMLFAAFFSAVLLAITSFAKSFKEAQAYLIPLMLVSLAPGIFALTPGLKMNGVLAAVPLVNIVLLGRDLLEGQMVPLLFVVAVVSTILYSFLALVLAARVFGSDAILYGSQGSLKDLFQRPPFVRPVPTLTQLALALAVLFPSFVILGGLPSRFPEFSMGNRLGLSAGITILLFVGWPLVMVWRNNVRFKTGFRTKAPPWWSFAVAFLWGLALWIWAYELEVLTVSPSRLGVLRELFETIKRDLDQVPLAWRLACLAVVPAVCEEWFFRGYLLSGLRARTTAIQAVFISAALFGLFHVVVRDVLFFERFLPTAMMGLMLGWLAVRSGSVWPGVLLHVLHNGLLLTMHAYQKQIMNWGVLMETRQHLPWPWLLESGAAIGVGAFVLIILRADENDRVHDEAAASNP